MGVLENRSDNRTHDVTMEKEHAITGETRIIVISALAVLLGIAVLVLICLCMPKCCRYKKKKKQPAVARYSELSKLFKNTAPLYSKTSVLTHGQSPTEEPSKQSFWRFLSKKKSPTGSTDSLIIGKEDQKSVNRLSNKLTDSNYSSLSDGSNRSSAESYSRVSSGNDSIRTLESPIEEKTEISFEISFIVSNEEKGAGKLLIGIMDISGLCGPYSQGGACDPYVIVSVWRNKSRNSLTTGRKGCVILKQFQTRTVRRTTHAIFNEVFAMDCNRNDLKDLTLTFVVMDNDKWVSPTNLGELTQPLRDIKALTITSEKMSFNHFLAASKTEFGKILFGMTYLPTAQRLSISLMKAENLKFTKVVDTVSKFRPYVRLFLIGPSRKLLARKKSSFISHTEKPSWNETVIFDLSPNMVENVVLVLAICSKSDPSNDSSDPTPENETSFKTSPSEASLRSLEVPPRNSRITQSMDRKLERYVGKVVMGCDVSNLTFRQHWNEVFENPRKIATKWHNLI